MIADSRENRLVSTFVTLADTLVAGFDVVDLLQSLIDSCADLFGAAHAGILLEDGSHHLSVIVSTSEHNGLVHLLELEAGSGPCIDSYTSGATVAVPDAANTEDRWPGFAELAGAQGLHAVHAVPLRLRSNVIGALALFFAQPTELGAADASVVRGLADVATIGILQERAHREQSTAREQLQAALTSRVTIEQAKGVIAQLTGSDMDSAFRLLREYAGSHSLALHDVAELVVARQLAL